MIWRVFLEKRGRGEIYKGGLGHSIYEYLAIGVLSLGQGIERMKGGMEGGHESFL